MGGRTKTTDDIVLMNKMYSEEINGYKEFAKNRRNRRVYTQEKLTELHDKLVEYVSDCDRNREPLTIAGIQLALGIDRKLWSNAKNEQLDYLLEEYLSINNITADDITEIDGLPYHVNDEGLPVLLLPYSRVIEKAYLLLQQQLEKNCYQNRGNPAGSIFSLKHNFQWREDEPTTTYSNQTLIIADKEQATKALQMLQPSNCNDSDD